MTASSSRNSTGDLPAGRLVEVGDGVHAYVQPDGSWWVNNAGFVDGGTAALSIDACATERRTRRYLEAIAGRSATPVRTLVNTHHHSDHTFGNYLFADATVIAHERTRSELLRTGGPAPQPFWDPIEFGHIEISPPTITFENALTAWVGDLECRVSHVGTAAHTTNDSIVWIESQGVLFAGDLVFNGATPFYVGGSVLGAITVLRDVLAPLDARVVVAGHGEVADSSLIARCLTYLEWIQSIAEAGSAAGLTPLELARNVDLGEFATWSDPERTVGNLHRAYAELAGAEPGRRIDVRAAMQDMVAYNGGRPLTCRA
jgi:cyclase